MNSQDKINEIRNKIDIVDVITSYIPLTKKGKNYFGICPFHDDNNPSMSVSREKQIYRCFSCGASGNVFTFVENYEQISFRETLEKLASLANVELDNKRLFEKSTKYDKLYEAYDLTNKVYQNNLRSSFGKEAISYLKSRELDDDTIKHFEIGLATNNNEITNFLLKKNYPIDTLNNIGLSTRDKDMYNNRIMFPLKDTQGRVVAFSGRIYNTNEGSKYINTKETEIFKKGLNLYNYHEAKEEVRIKKYVIVMEGFMDVIRSYTVGVKNVVALMGTAMTKEQLNLIKKLSNNIILLFDGDDAGIHATLTNGEELIKQGLNVKVCPLTDNYDPDTYILKYKEEGFKTLIKNAIFYNDFKINELKKNRNFNSDEEISRYINDVIKETSLIKDEIRREIILKKLAIEFNLSYNTLEKRLNSLLVNEKEEKIIVKPKVNRNNKYTYAEESIIYNMFSNYEIINYYNNHGILFYEDNYRRLASEMIYYFGKYGKLEVADFLTYLNDKEELLNTLNKILINNYDDVNYDIILDYIKLLEEYTRNQEIKRLKEMIKNTSDENIKIELSEKVRKLKIGSEKND